MILLLPLILVELYLVVTLILLEFGPIVWNIENKSEFWILIFSYHLAFIFGYLIFLKNKRIKTLEKNKFFDFEKVILKYFWAFLFLAFIGSLIAYKNSIHSSSYIPYDFFNYFFLGLTNHGLARAENVARLVGYESNKLVTMFYATIVIFKYSLVPVLVLLWDKIKLIQKIVAFPIALIPFVISVSAGSNKLVFDTLLMFLFSLFIVILINHKNVINAFLNRKFIIFTIVFLFMYFPYNFNKSMSARAPTFQYMEKTTKPGNINYNNRDKIFLELGLSSSQLEFLKKVDTYLVQGYYGMSVAIDEPFDTTYGIGHSIFLLDQFKYFFNIDLIDDTYQYKIDDEWDRLVQWHSFYSQVANDVGFYGVIIVMLIIGYIFSLLVFSAIKEKNIIAQLLLLLFAMMFMYMPANNQVFNFMETLFAFWTLLLIWSFNKWSYKNKLKKGYI